MRDYISKYTGKQIDEAVDIALNFNPKHNAWVKLPSSNDSPINLDILTNPGNFSIGYFYNGSITMMKSKPINFTVMEIDGIIIQYSLVWNQIETRKLINGEWTQWTFAETVLSNYVDAEIAKLNNVGTTYDHIINSLTDSLDVHDIIKVNNQYIIVGKGGTILASIDNLEWVHIPTDVNTNLNSISYLNGRYFILGDSGTLMSSPNLIDWITHPLNTISNLMGIAYSGAVYVVTGEGYATYSSNLTTWVEIPLPTTNIINDIIYNIDKFIMVGTGGTIMMSIDGNNWIDIPNPLSFRRFYNRDRVYGGLMYDCNIHDTSFQKIKFINGVYIVITDRGEILYSTNLEVWTLINVGQEYVFHDIIHHNGQFVVVGDDGLMIVSNDLIKWTDHSSTESINFYGIINKGDEYIIIGSSGNISITTPRPISIAESLNNLTEQILLLAERVDQLYLDR